MRVAKEATSEDFPQHLKPLPRSLEKYVAYCDILYQVLHLDAYNWQTLVLSVSYLLIPSVLVLFYLFGLFFSFTKVS